MSDIVGIDFGSSHTSVGVYVPKTKKIVGSIINDLGMILIYFFYNDFQKNSTRRLIK